MWSAGQVPSLNLTACACPQLDRMEIKLNENVTKLQGCQERKLQLEENVQRFHSQLRDMKNTLEKYVNSMTVSSTILLPKRSGRCLLQQESLLISILQSLADQKSHLKEQMKELEANVLAAAPDKTKQKQMEKCLENYKKGACKLLSSFQIASRAAYA